MCVNYLRHGAPSVPRCPLKRERLVIKCGSKQTVKEFKRFAVDFDDFESALKMLLNMAKEKGYVLRT
jgi:hypothetical protein